MVDIDLGIDWRGEPPAQLAIGPVLALRDAVGSKFAAVYSRGEAGDFLDLDAIRQSGRFTDAQLLALAKDHDPGFEPGSFALQLSRIRDQGPVESAEYGTDAAKLEQIQLRLATWAVELLDPIGAVEGRRQDHPRRRNTRPNAVPNPRRRHSAPSATTRVREA